MDKLTTRETQVLAELVSNARLTDQEIARRIDTSRPTVARIREKLEQKGVIRGYVTQVHMQSIGLEVQAMIFYRWRDYARKTEMDIVYAFLRKQPEIVLHVGGTGLGNKTNAIISMHSTLRKFEEFLKKIKEQWQDNVGGVEVFLTSLDAERREFNLRDPVLRKLK